MVQVDPLMGRRPQGGRFHAHAPTCNVGQEPVLTLRYAMMVSVVAIACTSITRGQIADLDASTNSVAELRARGTAFSAAVVAARVRVGRTAGGRTRRLLY